MSTYRVIGTFINHKEQSERDLSIIFAAKAASEAIDAGIRWVRDRQRNVFEDYEIFGVTIQSYYICEVQEDGYCDTFASGDIFKWRRDHSEPLDIDQSVQRYKETGKLQICN